MRLFTIWDFSSGGGMPLTLESLQDDYPDGFSHVEVPGLRPRTGTILEDLVLPGIGRADRVLAWVDRPNANVGFEIGLAVGLGKPLALAYQGVALPSWLGLPPLANHLVQRVDGVDALHKLLPKDEIWLRSEPVTSAGVDADVEGVLFLCPKEGGGQACRRRVDKLGLPWKRPPSHNFVLSELPDLFAGVGRVIWTLCSFPTGTQERDGAENAALAVIAGFFAGGCVREAAARDVRPLESLRRRLIVLREQDARGVVDVQLLEQRFASLAVYGDLLTAVVEREKAASARQDSSGPASAHVQGLEGAGENRTRLGEGEEAVAALDGAVVATDEVEPEDAAVEDGTDLQGDTESLVGIKARTEG